MTKTVMIIEDNDLNMKLFGDLLDVSGYRTLKFPDGRNAIENVRRNMPDLVLIDIQLPEVSGLDVIQWLKAEDDLRDIPIIAVTAFAMKGDEEKIRRTGCDAYISKPIVVREFIATVKRYLGDG